MNQSFKRYIIFLLILVLFLLIRIPFASKYIFNWDGIQYVLGVQDFDILHHQPHPPGFINFIAVAKFINIFLNDSQKSLDLLMVLSGALSSLLFYLILMSILKSKEYAFWGILIFISSPVLWFYSEIINNFMPALTVLLLFIYMVIERRNIYFLSFFAGWILGIRIYMLFIVIPILALAVLKNKFSYRKLFILFLLFVLGVLLWFLPTIYSCGGLDKFIGIYQEHINFNFEKSVFSRNYSFAVNLCIILIYAFFGVRVFLFFTLAGFIFYILNNLKAKYLGIIKFVTYENNAVLIVWLLGELLFYSMFPPVNSGYIVSIVSICIIFSCMGMKYVFSRYNIKKYAISFLMVIFILFNFYYFLFETTNISLAGIRKHDEIIFSAVNTIRSKFKPNESLIISYPYFDYGLRHAVYYLPEYYVFLEEEINEAFKPIKFIKGRKGMPKEQKSFNGYLFPKNTKYIIFFSPDIYKFELAKIFKDRIKTINIADDMVIKYIGMLE